MKNGGYEEIDHTADLALRVWGEDFYALLIQSAKGMYELMNLEYDPNSEGRFQFLIKLSECENMLVDFLSELLFVSEDKQKSLADFSFEKSGDRVNITAKSYAIQKLRKNIKAVTFHDLEIKWTEKGQETVITFDV